jgi:hypothetical protein
MINSSSQSGAVGQTVYTNGSTTMIGQNRYWIVSNTPYTWNYSGNTPFNFWTIDNAGVVTAVGSHTCTASTTTTTTTSAANTYYLSSSQSSLGNFCNTSTPVQTTVYSNATSVGSAAIGQSVYTSGNNLHPGGLGYWIVYVSPYHYGGGNAFAYWQINSSGVITAIGTHTGCAGTGEDQV